MWLALAANQRPRSWLRLGWDSLQRGAAGMHEAILWNTTSKVGYIVKLLHLAKEHELFALTPTDVGSRSMISTLPFTSIAKMSSWSVLLLVRTS